jgi:hypothetical protein
MNWDAIGAVGEILGATAVLVTLIYRAAQAREAKETVRRRKRPVPRTIPRFVARPGRGPRDFPLERSALG